MEPVEGAGGGTQGGQLGPNGRHCGSTMEPVEGAGGGTRGGQLRGCQQQFSASSSFPLATRQSEHLLIGVPLGVADRAGGRRSDQPVARGKLLLTENWCRQPGQMRGSPGVRRPLSSYSSALLLSGLLYSLLVCSVLRWFVSGVCVVAPRVGASAIQSLHSFDPFADASPGDDLLPASTEDCIHVRILQRNGRETLITVQGIADDYDKKKLLKAFKKKRACHGTVIVHPECGEVIQWQGDQFLLEIGQAKDTC
ncbi:hypothetical protein QTO34_001654 [Cnephaeus nilssonii]|uniref:SUI1 domain-containing protein n=1 Tax=Cnephaeus nilssonii TaxID=3371016 RepID=A0AA40LNQ8_CNENI|nr:hypothetical protein QTO34_001654 [Eptesicus nilssonii]